MTDLSAEADVPLYTVTEFIFSSRTTDCKLTVMCRGKRLSIRLFASHFDESPQLKERYLFFLRVADEFELDGFTVEDFYDWVMEPFLPILDQLDPLDLDATSTLQDYFLPETHFYTVRSVAGQLAPFPEPAYKVDSGGSGYGVRLPNELCSSFPSFAPSELEICADRAEDALSAVPKKVRSVGVGDVFFLKLVLRGDVRPAEREIHGYQKIANAALDEKVCVSRLHGLVRNEAGLVLGMLLTYLDCRGRTLASAAKPGVPVSLRQKWAVQVRSTIERLHEANIIWGDVKPANVLIDGKNDAWVIDFGGGYTEGWVDKGLAGTVAGDLQGMAKIMSFLGV